MNTQDKEYMNMHVLWRSEIKPPEGAEIDETVFEEIYRIQEEEDDKERIHEKKE